MRRRAGVIVIMAYLVRQASPLGRRSTPNEACRAAGAVARNTLALAY